MLTECLSSIGLEADIWQEYSPASSGSAKEMTKVFPFSDFSSLNLAPLLPIILSPRAIISLPFFHIKTNPSENRDFISIFRTLETFLISKEWTGGIFTIWEKVVFSLLNQGKCLTLSSRGEGKGRRRWFIVGYFLWLWEIPWVLVVFKRALKMMS